MVFPNKTKKLNNPTLWRPVFLPLSFIRNTPSENKCSDRVEIWMLGIKGDVNKVLYWEDNTIHLFVTGEWKKSAEICSRSCYICYILEIKTNHIGCKIYNMERNKDVSHTNFCTQLAAFTSVGSLKTSFSHMWTLTKVSSGGMDQKNEVIG